MHRTSIVAVSFFVLVFAAALQLAGSEIELADGSRIRGTIVAKTDTALVVEVLPTGGGLLRLSLPASQIQRINDKPLHEVSLKTEEGPVSLSTLSPKRGAYAVLQLQGAVGTGILGEAFDKAIQSARRRGISDVVIVLDSKQPGSLEEALVLAHLMARHRHAIHFHALIKECAGAGIIIPLYAETVHLMPGATLTGIHPETLAKMNEEDSVQLANIAIKATALAQKAGKCPALVHALIDPKKTVVAWKSAQGEVLMASALPHDITPEKILFADQSAEKAFVLTADHLSASGIQLPKNADALGPILGLTAWAPNPTGIQKIYAANQIQTATRRTKKSTLMQRNLETLTRQRDAAHEVLSHAIDQAKASNPAKGNYATIERYHSANRRVAGVRGRRLAYDNQNGGSIDTKRMTAGSRKEWTLRSDRTIRYLNDALKALRTIVRVEPKLTKLGAEVPKPDIRYDLMEKDLKEWRKHLKAQRERIYK